MATDMQRLIVALEARTAAFEKAMNRANGVANRRARSIESRFARMNSRIGNSFAGLGKRWVAGLAAAFGAREIKELSDAATRIDNALKIAGVSGAELEKVYGRLRDSAIKNAAPIEALVELYGRAALVQKELGITGEELLGFTDKIAVALRVSGKSAAESSGALLQLSQALGSGIVRAEEFNSILEGALPIAQAAARGLKEAGGSVAKLRQLVVDGAVSSEAFFRAFEAGSPMLQDKVEDAEFTISQAMGNLRTSLIDAAREFNTTTGASQRFATGINNAANAISDFDVSGFLDRIAEAHGALEQFLTDLGDAQIIKDLGESLGVMDGEGNLLNLDAKAAKEEAAALEREVELLQKTIEKNSELGFDNTEAMARLDQVLGKLAQVRAAIAGMPQFQQTNVITGEPIDDGTRSFVPGTPGDPNALAQATPGNKAIKPVSLNDFDKPNKPGGGGRKGGGRGKKDEFQRETEQIRERTDALNAETAALAGLNPLINDYEFSVTKARAAVELETAAKKAGLEITPTLAAQIETLAASYATATAEANKLAESQERARETAEDMKALGKDVLGGFIKDLQAGKSASEALSNALGKVADKLLEIALNSIFDGGGGGLGGILGFIPKLFGFADGGVAKNGRPMRKFAKGGIAKEASIFGETGKPEAAVPLPDGRTIPVTLNTPNIPQGRPTNETVNVVLTDDTGRMANIADQRIQTAAGPIIQISVRESQKVTKQNMPGFIANAQSRSM